MGFVLPHRGYFRVIGDGEVVSLASISLPSAIELYSIRLLLYKHGTEGGSERFRLKIYRDSARSDLAYTSEYMNLSDIDGLGAKWFGWVSFLFGREHVPASTALYPSLEVENYTSNGDTYYLSFSLDWPNPQYGTNETTRRNLAMQIYGYEVIT